MLTFISDVSSVVAVNIHHAGTFDAVEGRPPHQSVTRCLGFGHRVTFGSRFPILLEERSPDLPGSLETNQDNRDIVDVLSMLLSRHGS
ncbi:hypothetical protein, partial [Rhizobium sp. BK060]|uniref:hypothetical protein n=1 Tax=Rhizobium sp. BK060 TaxID=2587096 RepID=UPI001852B17E